MILDGYNIIHRSPSFRGTLANGVEAARASLIAYCREWMTRRRDIGLFLVVFDGGPSPDGSQEGAAPGVRAVYSSRGETADHRIHALLLEWQETARCVVVSDDNEVIRRARQATSAGTMTAEEFVAVLRPAGRKTGSGGEADKAGLTPGQEKSITDELRRLWG